MQEEPEPGGGYRVDFFSGPQPTCQWFRSAVVLLETSDPAPVVSGPEHVRSVENWLTDYDAWYRSGSRLTPGLRVRLLYSRELWAVGAISLLDALCSLSELAHRLGMAFAYTFEARELLEHEDAARELAARPGLAIAGIRIGRGTPLAMAPLLEDFVVSLIRRGVSISIASAVERLRAFRLLENPVVSSAIFRLHPTGELPPVQVPPPPVPCAGLFGLYIARSGGVFPCRGLLDVPVACFGSVYRPFADSVLAGRPTALNLPSLARHGPVLESTPRGLRGSALPSQCERHRAQLLGV